MRVWGVSAIILSTILVVFTLEGILHVFAPIYMAGNRHAYQYDEELGCRLQDNLRLLRTTDYQEEIYTNQLGTANFQKDFADYQALVLAVGDSFTQGTGLPMDASYPFQLDLLLNMQNDHYVKKYAVVNLGVATYGGKQNLIALKKYCEKLGKPRYVLYLGCSNDYEDDLLLGRGRVHKRMVAGNPNWPWYATPLVWWAHETELGKRTKIALGNLTKRRIFSQDRALSQSPDKQKTAAELEEPIFQELSKLTGQVGAKLIVSWANLPSEQDGSYTWLKEFARRHQIAFADWYPAVVSVQTAIQAIPLDNPHSGGHYRTWVNRQIAQAYARHIVSPE